MRRLLILSGTLVGTLGIGIGLFLTIARTQLFSDRVQQLHLTECNLPCLAGITVDKTTIEDAEQVLRETFGPIGFVEEVHVESDNGHNYLSWSQKAGNPPKTLSFVQLAFMARVVTSISLGSNAADGQTMPNLAEVLLIFGPPTCLWVVSDKGSNVMLIYENEQGLGEMVIAIDDGLSMADPIDRIYLDSQRSKECKVFGSEWRGFTSRLSRP